MRDAGVARLRFAIRAGRTVLAEAYSAAPLHVRELLATSPAVARVALLTTGGGLLGDDHLRIELAVGPGAKASVATVGATRLLPAGGRCRQQLVLRLEPGSRLVYLPEPLIPCAGAAYEQTTTIALAGDATLVAGEVVTPGRLGSGEQFAYRRLDLCLAARCDDQLVLLERIVLEPAAGHLRTALGSFTHLASMVVLGPPATAACASRMRACLEAQRIFGGVSVPTAGVLVVRLLGYGAYELHDLLRQLAACAVNVGFDSHWNRFVR
ncbi:MAG TPA: urease accessory protein UreD [Chloroflexota bacterium]|nr:urease accessory protein UreD [Chloroflexota bacterium]